MVTTRQTDVSGDEEPVGAPPAHSVANRLKLVSLLFLSAWCGLVAGLLETGTIVLRKEVFDSNQLYGMSRHFVWLIPAMNVCLFVGMGLLGFLVTVLWPRIGHWGVPRFLCAVTLLPPALVGFPGIYTLAWTAMALGVATRLVPLLDRNGKIVPRFVRVSFPAALGIAFILGGSLWVGDYIKQKHARARPLPAVGSPNVVLMVMDTVAAGHLSLHGYDRGTSNTLVELAERGIRFESAQAAASWTLPSHAIMFTGRWLHELSAGWLTPLDDTAPTLAEFLGDQGYATAGFVANTRYCATDSGLARGFTHYQDFIFPDLTVWKTSILVNRALTGIQAIEHVLVDWLEIAWCRPYLRMLWSALETDRKGAAVVNRQFLDWLSSRDQPERPYFAFLNYFDAHYPYRLPAGRLHRFGAEPSNPHQRTLIDHWWELDKSLLSPKDLAFAADAYDDCIADLDEQVGKLLDELGQRGGLERTWLVIASDHGESFGEHDGVFCHGTSLYQTELHVPLLIIPPGAGVTPKVVGETVSLRDLAATIVEMTGLTAGSPFPGDSLARHWRSVKTPRPRERPSSRACLAEVVPDDPRDRDSWGVPKRPWPLGALNDGEWSYIRREGDVNEELFHLREDAKEQRNLARDPTALTVLERMRVILGRLTAGPLLPRRFSP